MKHTLTSLAAIACLGLAATAAHAADGLITFEGAVVDTSCQININGSGVGTPNGTVMLPTVSMGALDEAGKTDGTTGFTISLSGCTIGTKTGARAFFESTPGVTISPDGNLTNTLGVNGASNVDLRLLDSDSSTQIVPGDVGQESMPYTTLNQNAGGTTILHYYVQYYATGAAQPGGVVSQAAFSIIYN